jgi:hypothetical protein
MHFITFGSHANYIDAAIRLCNQAYPFHLFTTITAYTGAYLKKDKTFWKQHGEFITKHKRGFGYWIWKPYLISKTMNQLKDGEIILYLDCGCELDLSEKKYLLKYIEIVKKDKIMGCDTKCIEQLWNKRDLFEFMNMNKDEYLTTTQREAGALLILVCDETKKLVEEWYTIACDYHNIDDSPSIIPNCKEFKEHRHDQSIFSLLTKKYNIFSTTCINSHCIKYIRNRSGNTKLKPKLIWVRYVLLVVFLMLVQSMYHFHHTPYVWPWMHPQM